MPVTVLTFIFLLFSTMSAGSEPGLSKIIESVESSVEKNAAVQEEIDTLYSRADELTRKFRDDNRRIEDLRLYNRQLELRIKDQIDLLEQLKKLGRDASVIEKRIPSLLLRMIESLERFVALDIPFLPDERAERINSLKRLMQRGDISVAEQFRRVFDAYFEETEYGSTIGAYEGMVDLKGSGRRVTFLRIGRIALLYQTDDLSSAGMWDSEKKDWVPLGGGYKDSIRRAIAVAREQAAPQLMFVPVYSPPGEKN